MPRNKVYKSFARARHRPWVCALILTKNRVSSRILWIVLKIHQSFCIPTVLCVTRVSKLCLMNQIWLATHRGDRLSWCISRPVRLWTQTGAVFAILPFNKRKTLMTLPYHFQTHFYFSRSFLVPTLRIPRSQHP